MSITFDPPRNRLSVGSVCLNGAPIAELFDHGDYYGEKRWSVLMRIRSVHVGGYGTTPAEALDAAVRHGREIAADLADALDEIENDGHPAPVFP